MDAGEQERGMWEEMINNPSEWVEHSLPIRDGTADAHKSQAKRNSS